MYATDLSAALPHDKRQIFDSLCAEAIQSIRAEQHAQSTALQARKPETPKPVGDRMRVR